MNNNSTQKFLLLLLLFFAISLGVSYFTTDIEMFKTSRNLILAFIKALVFTIVFALIVMPKKK